MSRTIDKKIHTLLYDTDWLIQQHVHQKISITEISTLLSITPNVVRKALRIQNIKSPPITELREASNMRKYGVANVGSLPHVRDKAKHTMDHRYGGHNWSDISGRRSIRDATCLTKYGNVNVSKTQYAKQKAKKTNQVKYDRDHINQQHISSDVLDYLNDKNWLTDQHITQRKPLTTIAADLNINDTTVGRYLKLHDIETKHFFTSIGENEIFDFIQSVVPNTVYRNVRNIIQPQELDVYIPTHNLAVEFCGLYWHSDTFKTNVYHRDKLHSCRNTNIRLLTIFEDEWTHNRDIVKRKLLSILNIKPEQTVFARKTSVIKIDTKARSQFLTKYHIQGDGPGSITYGLKHQDSLVAVMTFRKRSSPINTFELNRYATSCNVPGGFTKLLTHFQRNHEWDKLISFADLRWSVGHLYTHTGWRLDSILRPDYYWCKNGIRHHKFAFRHKHLRNKLRTYDPMLSETVNCKNNYYTKIFNCGLHRYVLTNT